MSCAVVGCAVVGCAVVGCAIVGCAFVGCALSLHHCRCCYCASVLDCFEEQLLVASQPNVEVHYLGVGKGTYAVCCDRGHAGCLEEEGKDVAAAAHTSFATTRWQSESSDDSNSSEEEDKASDSDADTDADEAAEYHLKRLGDPGDAQHFKSHFKHLWDSTIDYDKPVAPGTAFMYKIVQLVLFKPSTLDATKCTVTCTCGFLSKIRLLDLFNMEIVSKHKYHTACFGQDFCLDSAHHAFTITASIVAHYCLHQSAVAAPASWTP